MAVIAAALVLAVVAGVFLSTRAPASPNLPQISAQELVSRSLHALAQDPSVSGDAQIHVDLGTPQLPSADGEMPVSGPLALLSAISGDHTLRVWRSRDGIRIAEILPAAERAVFANSHAVWLWNSNGLVADHVVARSGIGGHPEAPPPAPAAAQLDPASLAANFLHAVTPSTAVSVGDPSTVAGRPVYALLLDPRSTGTLVGRVEVDVDAQTWIPLRVAVFPRGTAAAALSAGYTTVSFDPIDPATFDFTPPPGSTVKTIALPGGHAPHSAGPSPADAGISVRTFGAAWSEVIAVRLPASTSPAASAAKTSLGEIEKLLPYSGPLLSIDLVDRGADRYVVAGMVPPSALAAAASRLP
jgi:hypothetical protein